MWRRLGAAAEHGDDVWMPTERVSGQQFDVGPQPLCIGRGERPAEALQGDRLAGFGIDRPPDLGQPARADALFQTVWAEQVAGAKGHELRRHCHQVKAPSPLSAVAANR